MLQRRSRLGKYEVMQLLGKGGMSLVYKGRSLDDGSAVALKVPHTRLHTNRGAMRQFFEEGRTLVHLHHPNIVSVRAVGQQDGVPYIVMEYIDGLTLTDEIKTRGIFATQDACRLLRPVADALDYSHSQKIFHCDVKPGNIKLTRNRQPVLVDFGIVQSAGIPWYEGNPRGSAWYMSPEQASRKPADGRSDQYSLAVVAYEMLAGRVPFDGSSLEAIVALQREALPPIPTVWSESVKTVMRRALEKDPGKRFSSCAEFVNALIWAR
jgi:serine/threonine-protein kinase